MAIVRRIVREAPSRAPMRSEETIRVPASAPLLLVGERGAGKEHLARQLHARSSRRDGPFIAVDGGAHEAHLERLLFGVEAGAGDGSHEPQRGSIEAADGGTLLLDDIAAISDATQEKLVRVIESGTTMRLGGQEIIPVDVRMMCTTRHTLEELACGRARGDLVSILARAAVFVPPLRERLQDLHSLVEELLTDLRRSHHSPRAGMSLAALVLLMCHPWPGNVRELRYVVERAFVRGIVLADGALILPEHVSLDAPASH